VLDARAYGRELKPLLGQAGAYARSLLRNRQDAEDAIQQAALRAWERVEQYDETRPFKGWWFAILRNCCFDILRQRSRSRTDRLDGVDPPNSQEVEAFDWERMDAGLRGLSEAHQEILRLKYYGGLNYEELAETLGIPKGTVMSRLHLARKALAGRLREETT
jgi:RNA polymerase sigma-70 factor (ECF subfamily)